MGRLGIRIVNVALFTLCCFLAATVVNQISAELLTPPAPVLTAALDRTPTQTGSWQDRQAIIDRNLFGSKLEVAGPEPEPEPEPQQDAEPTQLPLILLGTVAADDQNNLAPESARAAIQDKSTREHQVVAVGDVLTAYPQVTIKEIGRKNVLLDNRGRLEELRLDDDEGPQLASRTPRRPAERASRTRRPRPSSRLGDRLARLRDAQQGGGRSAANLFQQAKMQPKYEDGQMIGMQFDDIKPGSLWEKVGLSDGDVVTEVNGIEVNTAAASAQILSQFTEAEEFKITVRGANGETRQKEVAAGEVEALLE